MPNPNSPEFRIRKNAFSADIDHTQMTGGTLDIRKVVEIMSEHPTIHPQIVLFPIEAVPGQTDLHKGMHTLEHGLAYKGGLRDELVSVNPGMDRNTLLDISPYIHTDGRMGFRILSMAQMDPSMFRHAMNRALRNFGGFLGASGQIPFANEKQCGQFRFHDRAQAQYIVEESQRSLEFITPEQISFSPTIAVSDLRLLKPELARRNDQRFLTPEASYGISQSLEATFAVSWNSLGYGKAPELFVGTYGCMTGMYVVAGAPAEEAEEHAFGQRLQTALTRSLMRESNNTPDATTFLESQLALELVATHSPQVFNEAF